MKSVIILLLILGIGIIIANGVTNSLNTGDVLVYEVTITHGNQIYTYNYTFIINSINKDIVNFTVIIASFNNGTSITKNYIFPLSKLECLPYNGSMFNTMNLTFVGYEEFNGKNASVYSGYYHFSNLEIPIKAYYVNGILNYANGNYDNYSLQVSLINEYNNLQETFTQGSLTESNYIILAIVVVFIIIGVLLLIKIGKI
ncbi:hypothetical protein [Stygiolobus azoricus]|uniref:Uncharacterized protein n=1 Tax=Stygiolobus azoricus TaxID=41675 RepID=A0A650CR40_9CREN|nr:hypothetical protein [Stygiolobus azoricus]QGR20122.1 hypothetical protein D1868_09080 [Stygiolobus azoricus]